MPKHAPECNAGTEARVRFPNTGEIFVERIATVISTTNGIAISSWWSSSQATAACALCLRRLSFSRQLTREADDERSDLHQPAL